MSVNVDTKECPECKKSWVAGEIPEKDREMFGGKTHFSHLIGIETENYDGVSEWQCPFCLTRWSRWTGRKLC
jgi:hypothetical protein